MTRAPTLLVTGGTGFAMSHLVRTWLERHPESQVIAVDAQAPDAEAKRFFAGVAPRICHLQADILDPALWAELDAREDVSFVAHGAAVTSMERLVHAEGPGRPGLPGARRAIDVNIQGALNVIQHAAAHARIRRLVNVSSGSVYAGEGPDPLPEDGFVAPDGIYAITKYVAELFSSYAAKQLGLSAVSVRLSGVFGPMDRETPARDVRSAPRIIAERASRGAPIRVRALDACGDFVYAADVAGAIMALLKAKTLRYSVYNVAAGRLATFKELLETFKSADPSLEYREVGDGEAADLTQDPSLNRGRFGAYHIARIREDTGWTPRPLHQAVAEYMDWYRSSRAGDSA